MKVRLLKDWNYQRAGDVVEVFDPTGRDWLLSGIAEEYREKEASVERSVSSVDGVENAAMAERRKIARKP